MAVCCGIALTAGTPADAKDSEMTIALATTTSTENSGLLARLLPAFTSDTGINVRVIAVGSGAALKLGENGDVDVMLVHAQAAETSFMEKGYGGDRRDVMFNDFVLVGSKSDPARIAGCAGAKAAFSAVAAKTAPFVSRGDDSGTDQKEKMIWKQIGATPHGNWYIETGQGMEATLIISSEKQAYTLTDRATFAATAHKTKLVILCEKDPVLFNPYGVITVNPVRHPHVKYNAASAFAQWMTSERAQEIIGAFEINGKQVFSPRGKDKHEQD